MPLSTQPGPQVGPQTAQIEPGTLGGRGHSSLGVWFPSFLKIELSPYPGRLRMVTRMVIAATLTMLLIMSCHLVGAGIAGVYTLFISRETPQATYRAAWTMLVSYAFGTAYALVGLILFVAYPLTHVLWIFMSLCLSFFALKICSDSVAAAAFGIILTLTIPAWDIAAPSEALVVETLWTAGGIGLGIVATLLVEYVFSGLGSRRELLENLRSRLEAVASFLNDCANGQVSSVTRERLMDYALEGLSRLYTLAETPGSELESSHLQPETITLVGAMVDLCAAIASEPSSIDDAFGSLDRSELLHLAEVVCKLSRSLGQKNGVDTSVPGSTGGAHRSSWSRELASSADRLSKSMRTHTDGVRRSSKVSVEKISFVPDAFTNPEHLRYALKGCFSATLCYILMNAVAYNGIRTAIVTCFITSLTSTGSSRQKQLLRIAGATFGGLILGIGGQVFVLPLLNGIAGFTVFFVLVTFASSWFATSSPRLSYFGIQMALAFYLINLQEFYPQTNLTIGRDRVLGIALGLVCMWLTFDTVGARSATSMMNLNFRTSLGLMADFVQPSDGRQSDDAQQLHKFRDNITNAFRATSAQADGVMFETGQHRQEDLPQRAKLLQQQRWLRSLFVVRVGLLQKRSAAITPEPKSLGTAQCLFETATAEELRRLAGWPGTPHSRRPASDLRKALQTVRQAAEAADIKDSAALEIVLDFDAKVVALISSLSEM